MKLKELNILLEAQNPEQVYERYYSDIDREVFDQIVKADTVDSRISDDGKIKKVGAGAKWLLKIYREGNLLLEDLYKFAEVYDKYKNGKAKVSSENKDLMKIKSIAQLSRIVESEIERKEVTKEQMTKSQKINATVLVYESENIVCYMPETYEAANKLGKNPDGTPTKWCTNIEKYYKEYTQDGPLFVIINKKNQWVRFQLHFDSLQVMDRMDDPVLGNSDEGLIDELGTTRSEFKTMLFAAANESMKVNPAGNVGKMLYIYRRIAQIDYSSLRSSYASVSNVLKLTTEYENGADVEDVVNNTEIDDASLMNFLAGGYVISNLAENNIKFLLKIIDKFGDSIVNSRLRNDMAAYCRNVVGNSEANKEEKIRALSIMKNVSIIEIIYQLTTQLTEAGGTELLKYGLDNISNSISNVVDDAKLATKAYESLNDIFENITSALIRTTTNMDFPEFNTELYKDVIEYFHKYGIPETKVYMLIESAFKNVFRPEVLSVLTVKDLIPEITLNVAETLRDVGDIYNKSDHLIRVVITNNFSLIREMSMPKTERGTLRYIDDSINMCRKIDRSGEFLEKYLKSLIKKSYLFVGGMLTKVVNRLELLGLEKEYIKSVLAEPETGFLYVAQKRINEEQKEFEPFNIYARYFDDSFIKHKVIEENSTITIATFIEKCVEGGCLHKVARFMPDSSYFTSEELGRLFVKMSVLLFRSPEGEREKYYQQVAALAIALNQDWKAILSRIASVRNIVVPPDTRKKIETAYKNFKSQTPKP